MIKLGKTIKELRKSAGMNQHQLAKKVEITQSKLSRIEIGKYGVLEDELLVEFANALKCPLETLRRIKSAEYEQAVERAESAAFDVIGSPDYKVGQMLAESGKPFNLSDPLESLSEKQLIAAIKKGTDKMISDCKKIGKPNLIRLLLRLSEEQRRTELIAQIEVEPKAVSKRGSK